MRHIKTISRLPGHAQGRLDPLEQIVLIMLAAFFGDWLNFSQVYQNLQKYYRKTP